MRVRRGNLYATAMCQRNGTAERKTQANAAVAVGQTIAVLEAMKMEFEVRASHSGIIRALAQQPGRPGLCSILPESTELSHQALKQGLISLVVDSQPKLIAAALMDLLVELQTAPQFDPLRHRIHVPLQIVTSENL